MTHAWRTLAKPVKWLFTWIVALYVLFFEWGWEPLARSLARIAQLPGLRGLEKRIAALPPYGALAVFIVPAAALLPVKLLALWFIAKGHAVFGVMVIVLAKIAGTALVARLFILTQTSLMQLAWFARLFARWSAFKDRITATVRASAAWRAARRAKAFARRLWRRGR